MPSSKTAFFSVLHKRFLNKTRMSTRCLPAETPGAQGHAGFPRRPPSTLPSTHFFAPIPEAPDIAAKIFEISENVWGYDSWWFLSCFLLFFSPCDQGEVCFQAAPPGRPMVYDSVFRVKFRGFRRFYDFFLRRKHLESLVRVIRPFGVHLCATKAKKFSGLTFSSAGL